MKYSLRKSFSSRRGKEIHDEEHVNPRIDQNGCSNSNSNLVKTNQSKKFLTRRRRYSSSPPPPSSPDKLKSKTCAHPYNNHINDADDDDDDPFSSSTNTNTRLRPLDKLTYQIRKSFRNTLTRQRPRLESTNSNKRLIFNANDENRPVNPIDPPISTGLTSPLISSTETTLLNENEKKKALPKRRKAPLAPIHMNKSVSVPNPGCSTLHVSDDHQESDYVSPSSEQQQDLLTKKTKLNRSFRTRISHLLKKRRAKQQQQQQQIQTQNPIDEDLDHQHHDDQDEIDNKKLTLGQRFDTLRRSLHLGNRNSTSKGKRYLLSNE